MKVVKFDNKEYVINGDYSTKEIISMVWGIHHNTNLLCDNVFITYENTYNVTFHITSNFMGMKIPSMLHPFIYNITIKELKTIKENIYQL